MYYVKMQPERISIKGYKRNDCTINALGNALGLSYDLARKVLQTVHFDKHNNLTFRKNEPRTKTQFSSRMHVKNVIVGLSVDKKEYIKDIDILGHYSGKAVKSITLGEFAKSHQKGVYIVLVKSHLTTVIDGVIIDTWDSSKRVVEVACEMDINKAQKAISSVAKFYKMDSNKHIKKQKRLVIKRRAA